MSELTQVQKEFLDTVVKGSWSINTETGLVDVDGHVIVPDNCIKDGEIPVAFGKVTVNFEVSRNKLTTLKGCPYWVGGAFSCSNNKLTSYKYAPEYVGLYAYVWFNPISTLDWNLDYVGGKLNLDLSIIDVKFHGVIIPEIEALIDKGIVLWNPENYYHPHREAYYNSKIAEIL